MRPYGPSDTGRLVLSCDCAYLLAVLAVLTSSLPNLRQPRTGALTMDAPQPRASQSVGVQLWPYRVDAYTVRSPKAEYL